jgi:hypothetical protein
MQTRVSTLQPSNLHLYLVFRRLYSFQLKGYLSALLNRNLSANKGQYWHYNNKKPNYRTSRLPTPVVSELDVAAC